MQRVNRRNAQFQQWQALLGNRGKRQRAGEFLVHGVRPITMALRYGWRLRTLLYRDGAPLSRWATETIETAGATTVAVSADLLHELGEKADAPPELVAVAAMPEDDLDRIPVGPVDAAAALVVVFDRPTSPGNLGTSIRSADAFGAAGVVVTGHAADVYDPKAVRASTGSLFAVPTVRVPGPQPVLAWVAAVRRAGADLQLVGTDEHGGVEVADADLTRPTVLLVGNEASGLSTAWREACDRLVRIPITGSASSLNAATAASVALYEAARQRR